MALAALVRRSAGIDGPFMTEKMKITKKTNTSVTTAVKLENSVISRLGVMPDPSRPRNKSGVLLMFLMGPDS
jgi:hypothetical protein